MCEAYVHSAKRVALSLLSVLAVALLLSQCNFFRLNEKISESSVDYRGIKIEKNKSPLFKKKNQYYIEVCEKDMDQHFDWFLGIFYGPWKEYTFSDKEEGDGNPIVYYLPVSDPTIEENDFKEYSGEKWTDYMTREKKYFSLDKKALLSEKDFSQLRAKRIDSPESLKNRETYDPFYVVTERKKHGYGYFLIPFVVIAAYGVDLPVTIVASTYTVTAMCITELLPNKKTEDFEL